jgi:hypothetical protein
LRIGQSLKTKWYKVFNILVHGAETDVIRVFDDKLHLTEKKMQDYLKQADLEKYGFEKTVEVSTETDENGKTKKKKTIYYKVTDDCSRVMFWEGVLEKRLPEELKNSKILSTTQKEVQSRIANRKTKSCTVMLEIHPNKCLVKTPDNGVSKRAFGQRKDGNWCWDCNWCSGVAIAYGK